MEEVKIVTMTYREFLEIERAEERFCQEVAAEYDLGVRYDLGGATFYHRQWHWNNVSAEDNQMLSDEAEWRFGEWLKSRYGYNEYTYYDDIDTDTSTLDMIKEGMSPATEIKIVFGIRTRPLINH